MAVDMGKDLLPQACLPEQVRSTGTLSFVVALVFDGANQAIGALPGQNPDAAPRLLAKALRRQAPRRPRRRSSRRWTLRELARAR